ncbi:hypothetical protein [Blastococcus capsensis]|uniref:hypothetical protein n=1 Tax=Blastococcus capsensis TaxID=1564163 RepID=UPI00253F7FBB|nr:hypothetical protein [Blastococcus capsensis]MDK3255608.1 hypothetical protein [Blastococcus capsensis]
MIADRSLIGGAASVPGDWARHLPGRWPGNLGMSDRRSWQDGPISGWLRRVRPVGQRLAAVAGVVERVPLSRRGDRPPTSR